MSDTSLRPAPVWDTMPGGVRMDDILPGPGGSGSDALFGQQNNFRHPSSAGPHQASFSTQPNFPNQQYASEYLTVEAPGSMRRVKSEQQRGTHQRQARSLDIRPTNSSNMLFPPPGPAQQDFMRQFLHPTEPVTSIARGHHRRSSSPSRERGVGGLGMGGMGMGGMGMSGMGPGMVASWGGSAGSARASPYPSPSVSPRPGYSPLPQDVGLPGLTGPGMGGMGVNMNVMPGSLSGQMGLTNIF